MLKRSELVLGFMIATAIWIVVLALQPQPGAALFRIDDYSALISALATIAIAVFTFTLWKSTDKLWKASDDQFRLAKETNDRQATEIKDQLAIARKASEAAQKSAEAAVATERARLYADVIEHNFLECILDARANENTPQVDDKPIVAAKTPMARIKFKNYGKTPAIVIEVGLAVICTEGPLMPTPVYHVKVVTENIIGPNQTTETFTEMITGQVMTFGQAKKVKDGNGSIWVAGYASYHDVFGEQRMHRFFQRLVRLGEWQYFLQAYDFQHYNVSN